MFYIIEVSIYYILYITGINTGQWCLYATGTADGTSCECSGSRHRRYKAAEYIAETEC